MIKDAKLRFKFYKKM